MPLTDQHVDQRSNGCGLSCPRHPLDEEVVEGGEGLKGRGESGCGQEGESGRGQGRE